MSQISLNPAASPVNTFAPAETRQGRGGSDLHQLAEGLQQFGSGVSTLTDRLFHDQVDKASSDVQRLQLENEDQFKDAVNRGDIKDVSNPWYMIAIQRNAAQLQTRRAIDNFQVWYDSSPDAESVRNSDNPRDVEQALSDKLGPVVKGFNTYQTQAAMPELEQFKQTFMQAHIKDRQGERHIERTQSDQILQRSNVASVSSMDTFGVTHQTDPSSQDDVNLAAGQVQSKLDDMLHTLKPSEAGHSTMAAVFDQGEIAGDSRLARSILSRVTMGGHPLSDVYAPELFEHEKKVDLLAAHRMNQQYALENKIFKDENDQLSSTIMQMAPENRLAAIQSLPGKFRMSVANAVTNGLGDERKFTEWAKTDLDHTAAETFVARELSKIEPADVDHDWKVYALVHDPLHYRELTSKNEWPLKTGPDAKLALYDSAQSNGGVVPWETLTGMVKSGQISQEDTDYWSRLLPTTKGKLGDPTKFAGQVSQMRSSLDDMVTAKWLSDGRLEFKATETNLEIRNRIAAVKDAFTTAADDMLGRQGNTLTYQEREQKLSEIRDRVVGDYGFTHEQWRKWNDGNEGQKNYEKQKDDGVLFSPDSFVKHPTKEGVWGVKGGGGTEISKPIEFPRMFQSTEDLRVNGPTVARKFGFTSAEQVKAFGDNQKKLLKATQPTK